MARQIICIHAGNKYSDDYVLKLHAGCRRNMDSEVLFTVLSDRLSYSIDDPCFRILPLLPIEGISPMRLWWYKMQAFRPEVVEGENLLLDLDLVITDDLGKFWDFNPGQVAICQDFNRHWLPNFPRCNSSVVRFDRSHASAAWLRWMQDPAGQMAKHRGDQDWMEEEIPQKVWWPAPWVMSWKWEVFNGGMKNQHAKTYYDRVTRLDPGCSIIAFHGKPDPHEIDHPLVVDSWRI